MGSREGVCVCVLTASTPQHTSRGRGKQVSFSALPGTGQLSAGRCQPGPAGKYVLSLWGSWLPTL